jgi:hypothetical protein
MTFYVNASKVGANIYSLWRIRITPRNKMQAQPLRKQFCAGHQLNVRDREGKGSDVASFTCLTWTIFPISCITYLGDLHIN